MRELAVDAFSILLYAAVAGVLTVAGALAEYASFQYVVAGETVVAVWLAAAGVVMVYAGVTVGRRKVLATLAGYRSR